MFLRLLVKLLKNLSVLAIRLLPLNSFHQTTFDIVENSQKFYLIGDGKLS